MSARESIGAKMRIREHHVAHLFIRGRRRIQAEEALERLTDRHGDGNYADYTLKLTFPANPNGLYLIKGGGPDVWRKFRIPRCWRKPQGFIHGKRCGTTQNIGVGGAPGPARGKRGTERTSSAAAKAQDLQVS